MSFFFFFQAEDGIRDKLVTGVQTCALPISEGVRPWGGGVRHLRQASGHDARDRPASDDVLSELPAIKPAFYRRISSSAASRTARKPCSDRSLSASFVVLNAAITAPRVCGFR